MTAKHITRLITDQITELLENLAPEVYTEPLTVMHGSSAGDHIRHILEFYLCLFEGAASGHVDYSSRKRNPVLAQNIDAAMATLEFIMGNAENTDESQLLNILEEMTAGGDVKPMAYVSSLGRELQYAFDHAVHHLAIVRIGLEVSFPGIELDPELGVAPSTIRYRSTTVLPQPEQQSIPEIFYS